MNKADERALKKHPRYAALKAAYETYEARVAAAKAAYEAEIAAADADRRAAAPELLGARGSRFDVIAFEALRPRGDKVRFRNTEYEIENVTAARIRLVGKHRDFTSDGYERGYYSDRIHPDDVAAIKAGTLKGWRQKPWGAE